MSYIFGGGMKVWKAVGFVVFGLTICSGNPVFGSSDEDQDQGLHRWKNVQNEQRLAESTDQDESLSARVDDDSGDTKALSLIFKDGFESGDTSAWGALPPAHCAVPPLSLP